MKQLARRRAACAVGAVLVLVTGCTSTSADGPTTDSRATPTASAFVVDPSTASRTPSASSSPSPSVADPPSSTSASLDPAGQEAADRAAIEAQWIKLWMIYTEVARIPPEDRAARLAEVTTSPLTENLVTAAQKANDEGVDNFGSVSHRIFWQVPINGQSNAVLADCQDQSQAGTIDIETGKHLTTGRSKISLRGEFVKGDDEIWRAWRMVDLGNSDC